VLILPPLQLNIDRWLKASVKCAALSLGCSVLGLLLFFGFSFSSKDPLTAQAMGSISKGERAFFPYESIGTGGLALHPSHAFGWVSRLASELALIAYNSRPDIDAQEAKILLSLKNGKEQLTLLNGRSLFLKESEQGKGLLSSETATGLWVKPILLDNGAVLIDAGRKLVSKEGQEGEEKGQFIVSQQGGIPACYNSTQKAFALALKSARGFVHDLFLEKYGGREYAPWKDKVVLELSCESKTYACFVSPGDYLLYEAGEWRVCSFEELRRDHPVARVKAASAKAIEIEVWDEAGFYPLQFKVEAAQESRLQFKPETMPSKIRLRSSSQISCALGKRRVILRAGDWLLKTATGWRNLRRAEEIQSYLCHRLKGELFIFDAIEKEQGNWVMKGHLFDETRTQQLPLTLPIDAEKPQGKTSRKRKPFQGGKG
jgi:hypothetical protein